MYKLTTKTGKEIVIRHPKMSDLKTLLEYINTLSKERTYMTVQGEQKTLKEEGKYLADIIKKIKQKKGVHLMAFCGDRLVSFTGIDLHENVKKHVAELGIAVSKDFRGIGLGKLMMKLVIAEAIKNLPGLRIIKLAAFSENNKAIKMYKKFGFNEYGRLPSGVLHRGKYIAEVLMYKKVR